MAKDVATRSMGGPDEIASGLVARIVEAADAGLALGRVLEGELGGEQPPRDQVAVLAFGKASLAMAKVAAAHLGPRMSRVMVVTLPEHEAEARAWVDRDVAAKANGALGAPVGRVATGDHPWPTARSVEAAKGAMEFVRSGAEAEVWVLVSGGGSAMVCLPHDGVGVEELARLTRAMQEAGATIHDLITVRRHLDRVKGGQLGAWGAWGAWGASGARQERRVRAFILSDVIGDALETIASGPTAADPTTPRDALAVLERLGLMGAAREVAPGRGWASCVAFLEGCVRVGGWGEGVRFTVPPGDARLARVENRIIASNALVAREAAAYLRERGIEVVRVEERVEGEAREIGARLAREAAALKPGQAIVVAGEWTVTVVDGTGAGPIAGSSSIGGPSQELALAAACVLDGVGGERAADVRVLALSTDGRDGPTDAAGAAVDRETCARARAAGVDPHAALARHDSTRALDAAGALIRTGATGTNLNHVAVAVAQERGKAKSEK